MDMSNSSPDITCSFTVEHYLGLTGEHLLYYIIYIFGSYIYSTGK